MRRLKFSDETETVAAAVVTTPDDQTVETDELEREIAGPSMGGVRSILFNNVSGGVDPVRLTRILNAAASGQPDEYYQLAEEMEEKYPHYQAVLKARKLAVTQLDVTIEAATDDAREQKDADLCREFINRGDLELEAFDILDSFGKGWSATEIIWPEGTARLKAPWMPKLKTQPQTHFEFDQNDGETLRLKGGPNNDTAIPTDLPPYKFIIHRTAGKTGLTVRGGLARSVAWCYLFQNMALKDWVLCARTYGMPIRVGKYDKSATAADRRKLLNAVMNIASDAAAIIPDSMTVEFVEAMAGATPDIYKELCEYADQSVSKLVLGQTATTDATAGGLGGSQGQVHDGVRERFQRADARALAATLKRDLFQALIDINHGPPPSGLYPIVKIGQAEEFTKEDLDIITSLVALGVEIEESVVRDKAGYPDPPKAGKDGQPVKLLKLRAAPVQTPVPESGAQTPAQSSADPEAAQAANTALNRILGHLKTTLKTGDEAIAAAVATNPSNPDLIDRTVEDLRDDWQSVMAPVIAPLEAAFAAATSYDDLKARLLTTIDKMDSAALAELLAEPRYAARLAGEAGVGLASEAGGH